MARRKRSNLQPFLLVIVDNDVSKFTIEGPMLDDGQWNTAVCEARSSGRNVRCFITSSDRASAISYQSRQGLTFVESGSIVQPKL
jgi:hypothetical protein